VMVRTVEAAAGKGPLQPPEERLVPDVHAEGHLWLAAVAAEVAFSHEQADKVSELELRRHCRLPVCFTVMLHGKHCPGFQQHERGPAPP
jgi:hypothetical protein